MNNRLELGTEIKKDGYSIKYKLMIYFVIATIHLYKETIDTKLDFKGPNEFRKYHQDIVDRVFAEGLKYFNYELSWNQMDVGIMCYLYDSQSVKETDV